MVSTRKITPLGSSDNSSTHRLITRLHPSIGHAARRCLIHNQSLIRVWESDDPFHWQTPWYCEGCEQEAQRDLDEQIRQRSAITRLTEQRAIYAHRQELAGVHERFKDASFDTLQIPSEAQLDIVPTLQRFIQTRGRSPGNLVCIGKVGTGKTFTASMLTNNWLWEGFSARILSAAALARLLREARWDRVEEGTESTVLARLGSLDLLTIDEIGAASSEKQDPGLLYELLNMRYERHRPTVLIGNLTMAELEQVIGERAIDRLRQSGRVLVFDWESRRRSKIQ